MPQIVEVPGLGDVEFPDNTPPNVMEAAIKQALVERAGSSQIPVAGSGFEAFAPSEQGPAFRVSDIPQPIRRGGPAAIGALAGGGLATLTGPAFPLSAPILTALGGLAGEGVAQATGAGGAQGFDPMSLLLASATPPGARTGVGAARIGARFGTPGRAALELNPLAQQEVKGAIQALAPAAKAGPLFEMARQQGSQIPVSKAQTAVQTVLNALTGPEAPSKGAQREFARVIDYAKGLETKLSKGSLTPGELQNELHAVGEIASSLQRQGGPGLKFISELKAGLAGSLDDAARSNIPGAATLAEARKTFLREQTVDDLAGYLEDAVTVRRGLGEAAQFNPNKMLQKLKQDQFYAKAFTAAERGDIEKLLKTLNKIPVLPPPGGQQFGSGAFMQRLGLMGLGAGGGAVAGRPITGAVLGAAIPVGADLFRHIGLALSMKEGRSLLTALLSGSDGAITPHVAAMLGAFAASQTGETIQTGPAK